MSQALSIFVFFISLMQSVNGVEYLNTASLSPLLALYLGGAAIDIAPITSIYAFHNQINLTLTLNF